MRGSSCGSRIFDLESINTARAESHSLEAANIRIEARASSSCWCPRISICRRSRPTRGLRALRAQLETAQALYNQAQDLRQGGIVAGIDVVRAEVRVTTERQRATASQADFEKTKLAARACDGPALGSGLHGVAAVAPIPIPDMTIPQALERAYRDSP